MGFNSAFKGLMEGIISTQSRKNDQISNFMKICPFGAEFFYEDGRTDMTKQMVAFRNFAKVPKIVKS